MYLLDREVGVGNEKSHYIENKILKKQYKKSKDNEEFLMAKLDLK